MKFGVLNYQVAKTTKTGELNICVQCKEPIELRTPYINLIAAFRTKNGKQGFVNNRLHEGCIIQYLRDKRVTRTIKHPAGRPTVGAKGIVGDNARRWHLMLTNVSRRKRAIINIHESNPQASLTNLRKLREHLQQVQEFEAECGVPADKAYSMQLEKHDPLGRALSKLMGRDVLDLNNLIGGIMKDQDRLTNENMIDILQFVIWHVEGKLVK